MEWLNDPKNRPIVIGILVAALVIILLVVFFSLRGKKSTTANGPAGMGPGGTMPGMQGGMPGMQGGMPGMQGGAGKGMPGMPGAGGGAGMPGMMGGGGGAGMPGMMGAGGGAGMPGMMGAGGGAGMPGMAGAGAQAPAATAQPTVTAKAVPVEKSRPDPFAPFNISLKSFVFGKKKQAQAVKIRPRIDIPIVRIFPTSGKTREKVRPQEPVQPARRMAGILLNSRIFAILETNGKYEIVQPGDTLADRLATVERVERDRVILRTTSASRRMIIVRMAAGNRSTGSMMPGTTAPGAGQRMMGPGMGPGMGGGMMAPGGAGMPGMMAPGGAGMPGMMGPGGAGMPGMMRPGGGPMNMQPE